MGEPSESIGLLQMALEALEEGRPLWRSIG